jgi:hypothetical protein
MTAAHVIEDAKRVYLVKNGQRVPCKVLVCDTDVDVAVLECEQENAEWFELLVVGDMKAIGFPKPEDTSKTIPTRTELEGPPIRFIIGVKFDQGASGAPVIKNDAVIGMVVSVDPKAKSLCHAISADVLATYLKGKK